MTFDTKVVEVQANDSASQTQLTLDTLSQQGYEVKTSYIKGNKVVVVLQKHLSD